MTTTTGPSWLPSWVARSMTLGGRTPSYGQLASPTRRQAASSRRASMPRLRVRRASGSYAIAVAAESPKTVTRVAALEPPGAVLSWSSAQRAIVAATAAVRATIRPRVAPCSSAEGPTTALRTTADQAGTACSTSAFQSPATASAFMRARCRNASCPASTLAGSPLHAWSADDCSARPYENESGHGPPSRWIVFLSGGQSEEAVDRPLRDLG